MAALRELVVKLFTETDTSGLEDAEKGIDNVTDKFKALAAGAAALFGASAIKGVFDDLTSEADKLLKASQTLGASIEEIQGLRDAAQFSGVAVEKLNIALNQTQIRVKQAGDGSGTMVRALDGIGLSFDSLKDKSPVGQFKEIGIALSKVDNVGRRNALSMELLGESGAELNRIFAGGEEATRKWLDELEASAPISKEFAENSAAVADATLKADRVLTKIQATLIQKFFPAILKALDAGERFLKWLTNVIEQTHAFEAVLSTVVLFMAAKYFPMLIRWAVLNTRAALSQLKLVAGIAAVFLIMEDLWGWLEGRPSFIGDMLNGIFGAGASDSMRTWTKLLLENPMAALHQFGQLAEEVASIIGDLFSGWIEALFDGSAKDALIQIGKDIGTAFGEAAQKALLSGFSGLKELFSNPETDPDSDFNQKSRPLSQEETEAFLRLPGSGAPQMMPAAFSPNINITVSGGGGTAQETARAVRSELAAYTRQEYSAIIRENRTTA